MKFAILIFAALIVNNFVVSSPSAQTLRNSGITNGGTISNGTGQLAQDGKFTMTYDFEFDPGKKNRVSISATGCKPNEFCAVGGWRITVKHPDYTGPMSGNPPVRANVREGKLRGFTMQ